MKFHYNENVTPVFVATEFHCIFNKSFTDFNVIWNVERMLSLH